MSESSSNPLIPLQCVRRLAAAEGYLELGMPKAAERELAQIPANTSFEGAKQFLKGHALRCSDRMDEALGCFRSAATLFPAPVAQGLWKGLYDAYKSKGQVREAREALMNGLAAVKATKAWLRKQIAAMPKNPDGTTPTVAGIMIRIDQPNGPVPPQANDGDDQAGEE
jgi:tetratricopeptide (TPR) repeat protein